MKSIYKICSIDKSEQKKIDLEKGVVPFVLTERRVDRDYEVIEPKGAMIDEYIKNPVVLWSHNMMNPPIGKVLPDTIKITKQRMTADVQFDLDYPFAALIFNQVAKGYLNAGSIRFIPHIISDKPVLEGQKRGTYKEWELLEFSVVPIPANPSALAMKELDNTENGKAWLEELKAFLDDDNFDHTPEGWVEMRQKIEEEDADDDPELEEEEVEFAEFLEPIFPEGSEVSFALKEIYEETEPWDPQKPFPNEHACRVKDPAGFVRFRRQKRDHEGKDYFAIIGFKSGGGSEDQSYRYPKDTWPVAEARAHCKSHKGQSFEPAKKEFTVEEMEETLRLYLEDEKAGRVLSAKTRKTIESAIAALQALLQADEPPKDFDVEYPHHTEDDQVDFLQVADLMNRLLKGEITISDEDRKMVYDHLAGHYKQLNKKAPDFNIYETMESKKVSNDIQEIDESLLEEIAPLIISKVNKLLSQES